MLGRLHERNDPGSGWKANPHQKHSMSNEEVMIFLGRQKFNGMARLPLANESCYRCLVCSSTCGCSWRKAIGVQYDKKREQSNSGWKRRPRPRSEVHGQRSSSNKSECCHE